jgi:DNA polymerase alpha-associated DNA helicase A
MHAKIAAFPSRALYGGRLRSAPAVRGRLLRDLPGAVPPAGDDELLATPVVFFDTAGCEFYERVEGEDRAVRGVRR